MPMSLAELQRALADWVDAPALRLAVRNDGTAALDGYQLTDRERARLLAMAHDARMPIDGALHRAHHLRALHSLLPLTLRWLGARAQPELAAFTATGPAAGVPRGREAFRFGAWLEQRIAAGELADGAFHDALRFELAAFSVRVASAGRHGVGEFPHPRKRLLSFHHEPRIVLAPPDAVQEPPLADAWLLLDASGGELALTVLDEPEARRLARLRAAAARGLG
jgi:hypothetical protein